MPSISLENTEKRTRKKSAQNILSVRTFNVVKYLVVGKILLGFCCSYGSMLKAFHNTSPSHSSYFQCFLYLAFFSPIISSPLYLKRVQLLSTTRQADILPNIHDYILSLRIFDMKELIL